MRKAQDWLVVPFGIEHGHYAVHATTSFPLLGPFLLAGVWRCDV
jgi:hypothetical protein